MAWLGLILALATTASKSNAECFDAAVVAHIVKQTPTPFPKSEPNEIVIRWPWLYEVEVEQRVVGGATPTRLTMVNSAHTSMRREAMASSQLILLKRLPDGRFRYEAGLVPLVEDRSGDLVYPVASPIDVEDDRPSATPRNYRTLLRSIDYDPIPWASHWYGREPPQPHWARLVGGLVVARRGIFLDDLIPTLRAELCQAPR